MKKNHRLNPMLIIALTLGIGFAIAVVSAAPPITVTSAVPAEAERGTTNLTVIINGRGFDNNMDVKFCRSETNVTCEPGGVNVQPGSVKFINSKKLEVTVDVGLEAVIGNFDIEAISLSSRRRGRGTENFAVLKTGGGGDDTYSLDFSAPIPGDSGTESWTQGSTNLVGFEVHHDETAATTIDLSFFASLIPADGNICFDDGNGGHIFNPIAMHVREGKRGRAEASVWVLAQTINGTPVYYLLQTVGFFDDIPSGWLPSTEAGTTIVKMTSWDMVIANGQKGLKSSSCLSEGIFDDPETEVEEIWQIDVSLDP